jgi:threonine dehydrogenase-like Zn-dependent dehydrogenase
VAYLRKSLQWNGHEVCCVVDEIPLPGPSECALKLTSLGLCSSDFHIWSGRKSGKHGVLGHEGCGEVLAVGSGVQGWAPGDRAIVNPLLNCAECEDCLAGRGQICRHRQIIGYNGVGLMASIQLLDARSLVRPPGSLPPSHGCLVEPLSCVVHAQRRLGRNHPESSMLIIGCGSMGALHAAYAKHRGVRRVLIADPDPRKLEVARSHGVPADDWLPLENVRERVRACLNGAGAEVSVIATSCRSGHELAFELTADGGQILAFASILDAPGPIDLPMGPFDSDRVHSLERTVPVLSWSGSVSVAGAIGFDSESFAEAADLLAGKIDGEQFVTGSVTLDEVPALIGGAWQRHLKILVRPQTGVPIH